MSEYATYITDHLSDWGEATSRRMFGGYGIFRAGLMFALIADDQLYLKADDVTADSYRLEGCEKFTYKAKGKEMQINYWSAPDQFFEDPDETMKWADLAFASAIRADEKKPGKNKRKKAR